MSQISKDAQYTNLNNQLRELQAQRAKVRPAVYILLFLVFAALGFAVLTWLFWLLAVASLLAAITAVTKGSSLDGQIKEVQARIRNLEG